MIAPAYAEHGLAAYSPALMPYVQTGVERAVMSWGDGRTWTHVIQALSALRSLGNDWDGEGSEAPRLPTILKAVQVARLLELAKVPVPTTAAAARSGGIIFGWEDEAEYKEIEVLGSDRVEWMRVVPGSPPMHGEIPFERESASGNYF